MTEYELLHKAERLNARDIFNIPDDTPAGVVDALQEHFQHYAKPIRQEGAGAGWLAGSLDCLKCGETLDGFAGTFQWGLAHGEGACAKCGWPYTAYHFIHDETGKEIAVVRGLILALHPDFVESATKTEDE